MSATTTPGVLVYPGEEARWGGRNPHEGRNTQPHHLKGEISSWKTWSNTTRYGGYGRNNEVGLGRGRAKKDSEVKCST